MEYLFNISSRDLKGKRVLVRLDLNVPIKDGKIADDSRIRAVAESNTIQQLVRYQAKITLLTHLGRFNKEAPSLSTQILAEPLAKALNFPVYWSGDQVAGDHVRHLVDSMAPDKILLLGNSRITAADEKNDPKYAEALAYPFDFIVFDAFGAAHRKHASTTGILKLKPSALGDLMYKELELLKLFTGEVSNSVAVIGGKKLKEKIGAIEGLLKNGWKIILGGVPLCVALKAMGRDIGDSLCQDDGKSYEGVALALLENWREKLILPDYVIIAKKDGPEEFTYQAICKDVPTGWQIVDIDISEAMKKELREAKRIIMAGPVGWCEKGRFSLGTVMIRSIMIRQHWRSGQTLTMVLGADTVAATQYPIFSTGGGAAIKYLSDKTLPVLEL